MKSGIMKISLLSGLAVTLLLCIVGSQISFSAVNVNSVLTRAEMMKTFGGCNCTHTYPRDSDCDDEDCVCDTSVAGTSITYCYNVKNGTGNSWDECMSEWLPDGVCKKVGDIKCQQSQFCKTDGTPSENTICSGDTCVNDPEENHWCRECTEGTTASWTYKKTYECTWD